MPLPYYEFSAVLRISTRFHKVYLRRYAEGENGDEFLMRARCALEEKARKLLGLDQLAHLPEGVRWAECWGRGHALGRWYLGSDVSYHETTGAPYVDRWRTLHRSPPHYDWSDDARLAHVKEELLR